MKVPNFIDFCKIETLIKELPGFYSEKGVKDIWYVLQSLYCEAFDLIKKIITVKGYESKLGNAGKLFKLLTELSIL